MSSSDITALMSALKSVSAPPVKKNQLESQDSHAFGEYMERNNRASQRADASSRERRVSRTPGDNVARPDKSTDKSHEVVKPEAANKTNKSDATRAPAASGSSQRTELSRQGSDRKDEVVDQNEDGGQRVFAVADEISDDSKAALVGLSLVPGLVFDESGEPAELSEKPTLGLQSIATGSVDKTLEHALSSDEAVAVIGLDPAVSTTDTDIALEAVVAGQVAASVASAETLVAAASTTSKPALARVLNTAVDSAVDTEAELDLTEAAEVDTPEPELLGNSKLNTKVVNTDAGLLSNRAQAAKGGETFKVDLAPAPVAAKATIEHAQGQATGLNHSYLTDRGAQVQGRAIMQNPMMAKEWNAEMAEKVAWFASKNISSAEIRLDPPELGSLHIRISVNHEQGQAQVNFVSPNANVRDALDQSANRLREMFESQGLDLVDVDVGSQQQNSDSENDVGAEFAAEGDEADELEPVQLTPLSNNLVDSYA